MFIFTVVNYDFNTPKLQAAPVAWRCSGPRHPGAAGGDATWLPPTHTCAASAVALAVPGSVPLPCEDSGFSRLAWHHLDHLGWCHIIYTPN